MLQRQREIFFGFYIALDKAGAWRTVLAYLTFNIGFSNLIKKRLTSELAVLNSN